MLYKIVSNISNIEKTISGLENALSQAIEEAKEAYFQETALHCENWDITVKFIKNKEGRILLYRFYAFNEHMLNVIPDMFCN